MFDIQEELKKLPEKPGVYLMKDAYDTIIYVGKAINLKNRVRQYFQNSRNHSPKTQKMVPQIREFEYIVTDSELEALILECNLIKKHRPKYNVLLKDDKNYPYIKVTVQEDFPRVFLTRSLMKDKAKYFGPYTDTGAVRETLELIHKIWPLRTCRRVLPRDIGKERPCLNYHIHQCKAPCAGYISSSDYVEMIEEVLDFLGGKYESVIEQLQGQMEAAAEELNFERAAEIRDQIQSVQRLDQKQKMIHASMEDQDVIAFAKEENEALAQVFFIRGGKLIGREHFLMDGVDEMTRKEIMNSFVKQFYAGTPFIPKEVILQEEIDEANIIQAWLSDKRGQRVYIKVPQKGEKSKLIDLAATNALLTLEQFGEKMKREQLRTKGALQELQEALGIEQELHRVEAFDISNTQGFESVGSMVVFEGGKPKRSDYRKFKIKYIVGPDDYGSMEEVLRRRFLRALEERKELAEKGFEMELGKFSTLPDLILMDGGKGQVNVAERVLMDLGLSIPVCGMVKDDRHRTRGLLYQNQEISLPMGTEGMKLVARIQDEAHRFAIEYHRKLRSKQQIQSVLDEIPGIGPVRRKALLQHFGSVEKIRQATLEEIQAVDTMNQKTAISVYDFFH
ncbi:MAG: excinuclease ABC subunit UvrC [Epulopiscium sp.]|nr:excinuclease ABC subunit UvrC [Candidatus Epulonipiscium sp.]